MITAALSTLLTSLTAVQQVPLAEISTSATVSLSPIAAVAPPACSEASAAPARGFEYLGEGTSMPAHFASDDVPLPVQPRVTAGIGGDVLAQPASGDPYFLGFTAGPHIPPADERVDPQLVAGLQTTYADGRPSAETYAFVMFSKRMSPERLAVLEATGCRLLGFHPHYSQKVALPAAAIEQVAALDFVRWIGVPRSWQKVHPRLLDALARTDGQPVDVFVNVFDSDLGPASTFINVGVPHEAAPDTGVIEGRLDQAIGQAWVSNGWQQLALAELGLEVSEYIDSIRAFRARMSPATLEQLVALDFVQFVEPDLPAQLAHDESMPMVLADYSRIVFDGSWNGNAMAGVIDSGLQIFHEALIPHVYIGWDVTSEGWAYLDSCGHGSHVAGTVWGAPPAPNEHYTGMAPGLGFHASRRARVLKMFSGSGCASAGVSHATLYSYMHGNYSDGTYVSPPPQAVNCSWGILGSTSSPWSGSDASSRTLDQEVFDYGQMYVFAAGNEGTWGTATLRSPAVAKNAFTVGSLDDYKHSTLGDPGHLSDFSSRGPCGDGRWKPNVVAPGSVIASVNALGGNSSYTTKSGTSMAAPHVTGFAAMMADSDSYLHYRPHLMSSLMMATALTHDDEVLTYPTDTHLREYGAGMINTQTPMYGATNVFASGYQFAQDWSTWQYGDFAVYGGCKRLVVCMTYHEPAASSGASMAMVNNFDLFLDSDFNGIDPNGHTGDYFAHNSGLDNTEIRIIDNPIPGIWRWKTFPSYVFSGVKMSVALTVIYANTKPSGSLTLTASDQYVRPLDLVDISAYAYNPEYFATNVFIDSTSTAVFNSATISMYDGTVANLIGNSQLGQDVLLGTIGPGLGREVDWQVFWQNNGVHTFQVSARSENWVDRVDWLQITVDGVAPVGPTNLGSTTHPIGVLACSGNASFSWTAASDALSGLDQYVVSVDQSSTTVPVLGGPGVTALASSATSCQLAVTPDDNAYYCHLRALDRSGNYGATVHYGPFHSRGIDIASYCTGKINSLFCIPTVGSTGTPQINGGNLTVRCTQALNNKNGFLFWGETPQAIPFQDGTLCVQSPLVRTPVISSGGSPSGNDCTGTYAYTFTQAYINAAGLHAGDEVYCQWWMRDPAAASTTGLSDALRFTLCQ